MKSHLGKFLVFSICAAFAVCTARADYPKPSPYPISWELNFEHSKPKRIVVDVPGQSAPKAYWYMTYTVTNNFYFEDPDCAGTDVFPTDTAVITTGPRGNARGSGARRAW